MNLIQQGATVLMKSALTGQRGLLPDGFTLDEAYPILKRSHMDALVYEGAVNCGISGDSPLMENLFQRYCRHLMVSERQLRQVKRICAAFEENGIDYLPLKGCRMKHLYPKPELRYMGDADILIRMEQYDRIICVMKTLGFQQGAETDHELHWKHPELNLELHKRLIPTYNEDFNEYYDIGWHKAVSCGGHYWAMGTEDEWLYLFTHFTKHFRDGGIGCRHMVDLWVYLSSHEGMNQQYLQAELKKLHLLEFYENICRTLSVWFEEAEPDAITDVITDCVFNNGSWGNEQTLLLSLSSRHSVTMSGAEGKLIYLWRVVFPDLYFMQRGYPVLKKAPWLLPAVWIYRLFRKVLIERGKVRKTKNAMDQLTTQKLNARKQLLNELGLEIRFK